MVSEGKNIVFRSGMVELSRILECMIKRSDTYIYVYIYIALDCEWVVGRSKFISASLELRKPEAGR